jgi:glycosyltransferase involved in cell wall biosynthesis
LVDDGSTDGSTAAARRHAELHPDRIRYLEHPGHANRGMSQTRNLGIAEARGEYVSFLDADDLWVEDKLERQLTLLEGAPEADFLCAPALWWYGWTGEPDDVEQDFVQRWEIPQDAVARPPALLLLFLGDEWASLCDVLIPKVVLEALGGYEGEFRGLYEDQAFHTKLCLEHPAFVAGGCWYRYRQHGDSCCQVAHETGRDLPARRIFLEWVEAYVEPRTQPGDPLWKAVQRELWPFRHPRPARIRRRIRHHLHQLQEAGLWVGRRTLPAGFRDRLWKTLASRR